MYQISKYTEDRAKDLGVKVIASTRKNKKIDVLDYHNNYICSIGDIRYKDYPSYVKEKGKEYADQRRRLYKLRHQKTSKVLGSCSYYSANLLW
jgi:hypothetical protein